MFASLRNRNFRLFFVGQNLSTAGNWMQNVAVGWLTLQLTNNGLALGLMAAARFVPVLFLGVWGGLVADRHDKYRILMTTQVISATLAAVLGVLVRTDANPLWALFAIVLCMGAVNVFDGPARQSLINNLVPRPLLVNAIALMSISVNLARVLGPALAGGLIASVGIALCFFANAISFLLVIAFLLRLNRQEFLASENAGRHAGQIRSGFRYITRTPDLLLPLIMVAVAGTFAWEFPVTLPLLTSQTFGRGPDAYATALACLGTGCVIGGAIAARSKNPSTAKLFRSALLWGGALILASFAPTLWVAYALLVPVGIFAVTFNSTAKTVLQLASPSQMRGRVMSLWSIAWQGTTVIGAPLVGALSEILDPRAGLWAGGICTVVAGAILLLKVTRGPDNQPNSGIARRLVGGHRA